MTDAPSNTLVLAGTGKAGSGVAAELTKLGLDARTAAGNGADVRFDWDDPTTHSPALEVALRAVDLDLMGRGAVRHSILRPAWFMQNPTSPGEPRWPGRRRTGW